MLFTEQSPLAQGFEAQGLKGLDERIHPLGPMPLPTYPVGQVHSTYVELIPEIHL